jgi:hypothetical protein
LAKDRIAESQLATSFAIHEARVAPLGDGWRVSVRGARLSWSRSQFLGEDRVRYTVDGTRTPAMYRELDMPFWREKAEAEIRALS